MSLQKAALIPGGSDSLVYTTLSGTYLLTACSYRKKLAAGGQKVFTYSMRGVCEIFCSSFLSLYRYLVLVLAFFTVDPQI